MGTNYYFHTEICDHCQRSERQHIGKSSGGWCFTLHIYPEDGILDLPDWQKRWEEGKGEIRDEYGTPFSPTEMLRVVTERGRDDWEVQRKRKPPFYDSWAEFHRENHSTEGPKGLLRHLYQVHHHGEGTWDCVAYEFS